MQVPKHHAAETFSADFGRVQDSAPKSSQRGNGILANFGSSVEPPKFYSEPVNQRTAALTAPPDAGAAGPQVISTEGNQYCKVVRLVRDITEDHQSMLMKNPVA